MSNLPQEKIKQAIYDIERLADVLGYPLSIIDDRPSDYMNDMNSLIGNSELAGIFLLRDKRQLHELLKEFPKQKETLLSLDNRCNYINFQPGTIGAAAQEFNKESIWNDSMLRTTPDGKIWGMIKNIYSQEEKVLLAEKGEIIPDFQKFLYDKFEQFLNIDLTYLRGKANPFKKIVSVSERVFTLDIWEAWDFLKKLGYDRFINLKIAQGAKNGEPWPDFKKQMLHINKQIDKINLTPDLTERKTKLLIEKSKNVSIFLVFQEHAELKEAISAIEKRIDAEIAICDIRLKQTHPEISATQQGNKTPIPYALKVGQEKYCELSAPEEGQEIISHHTLDCLAKKLENGSAKWLKNKATIGKVKLKLNPTDGKYWIYQSEKEHFPKKPVGRPRKT